MGTRICHDENRNCEKKAKAISSVTVLNGEAPRGERSRFFFEANPAFGNCDLDRLMGKPPGGNAREFEKSVDAIQAALDGKPTCRLLHF